MRTQIRKWGNSLGLRLPQSIAKQAGIDDKSVVEIHISENVIKITKIAEELELDLLLNGITEENLHTEINTNDTVGEEVW